MCDEHSNNRRIRLDEETQPQDKRTFDSEKNEQALLDVLLERMRTFEKLLHSSWKSKAPSRGP